MTFNCDQDQVNWQLPGALKCYRVKKRKKNLFTRTPGWEEAGNGSACIWEDYSDKPLRVKERTLKGYVSTDGA